MLGTTVAAIATPPGQGGIGIIRISGEQALAVLKRVFSPVRPIGAYQPRVLYLGSVLNNKSEALDQALAVYMPAPHSYTGEDVVELQCHGGYVVCQEVLAAVLGGGAVLAEPGEFTSRAFINGKLSLDQAESVIDIIQAKSAAALKVSARQLMGSLQQRLAEVADALLDILARLELAIDYPEELDEQALSGQIAGELAAAAAAVDELLSQAQSGRLYREGALTAIIGPANAGKSTLLNALLETDRAIVTPVAGTTRDTLEETYILDGLPLCLVDTAGIRETADPVEQAGIERSRRALAEADLILLLFDAAAPLPLEGFWRELLLERRRCPLIVLLNKADSVGADRLESLKGELLAAAPDLRLLFISAKEGGGLAELKAAVKTLLLGGQGAEQLPGLINARQQQALSRAAGFLADAGALIQPCFDAASLSIDVQSAWQALAEISGRAGAEEIIDRVFSRFCLGK